MLYISLNRDDYSCYVEEKEILLQAGLSMKVMSVEKSKLGSGPSE
jgi:hypothetical protein|tara:strand:+ start:269 stop:403 length:135 start_codon:yes stop_codon:yes gene_type:complete